MKTKAFLTIILLFISLFLPLTLPASAQPAGAEEAKVKALLSHVSSLEGATFIRNGKDYDAKTASEFLRRKADSNKESIKSAEDFINVAATKSSTTGQPYLIRLKDGKEVKCADYLRQQLAGDKK